MNTPAPGFIHIQPTVRSCFVMNRNVVFKQIGVRNSRLALKVSDGLLESDVKILRITAMALIVKLETANKRASVVQGSFLVLTEDYVLAKTNAEDDLEIVYMLTRIPKYGEKHSQV